MAILEERMMYVNNFFIWTRLLKHDKYVEVDIEQNINSTVIFLSCFSTINQICTICKEVVLFIYLFT